MIAQIVSFKWKESVAAEQIDRLIQGHQALAKTVEGLVDFQFGPGLNLAPSTADYGVVVVANDMDGIRGYAEHPDHVALVNDLVSHMYAERIALQIDWTA